MWVVSEDILNKLKCSRCGLFVKSGQIQFCEDAGLVCELCSTILPADRTKYWRQNGLEDIVEHIVFPCRYERYGCPKRDCNNILQIHEDLCKYRNKTMQRGFSATSDETELGTPLLDELPGTPFSIYSAKFFPIKSESKGLTAKMNCTAKGNKTTKKLTVLKYSINIIPEENKQLCLVNNSRRTKRLHSDYIQPIELAIEGAISLQKRPANLYCNLKLAEIDENMNAPLISEKCKSCNGSYYGDKLQCGYGHTLCTSCKRSSCNECSKQIEALSTVGCINFGCLWRGAVLDLHAHEKDCPSTEMHCIFNNCEWKSPELLMKSHVNEIHPDYFHQTDTLLNEFTQNDQLYIMYYFNKLFVCKYYNYKQYVEIIVEVYSKSSSQDRFTYTIEVLSQENAVVKSSFTNACSIFNHSILDPAVSISLKELKTCGNKYRITLGLMLKIAK